MDKTKATNKDNTNQMSNILADQKVKYEVNKDQERKRRFAILSGNIQPIHTSFNLKSGEKAYFQIEADRMAEQEYVESYTTGEARSPFIKGGLLRGNSQINTTTRQERVSNLEIIDTGTMIFTNTRMVFIGKEVISISYEDILSVDFFPYSRFGSTSMIVKYPTMLKSERYDIHRKNDAKLYYQSILRLTGRDKRKITEADVDMDDYPESVADEDKIAKELNPTIKNILISITLFIILVSFFRSIIVPINYIVLVSMVLTGLGYVTSFLPMHRKKVIKKQRENYKQAFFWSLTILFLGLIVAATSTTTPSDTSPSPAKTVRKLTITPTLSATDMLVSHGKKLKSIDDQVIDHEMKLGTKCSFIINNVANNNMSFLSSWSTAYDPIYDTQGERNRELDAVDANKTSSTSATVATWDRLVDVDQKIEDDLDNVANQCDNLSSDTQAIDNISSYESVVKADQADIANLMTQRKTILTSLGY